MEESALKMLIAALESQRDALAFWLNLCSLAVAVGVIAEIAFVLRAYSEDMDDWRRGIVRAPHRPSKKWLWFELFGVLLVSAGVAGEFWVDVKAGSLETQIRKANGNLVLFLEQKTEAASKSAQEAEHAAGRATELSDVAKKKAESVFGIAAKANESATGALAMAGDAKAQVGEVKSNIADVDAKYAPRTLSKINREVLIEFLRKAPVKPKEPIQMNFDVTATDGEVYGREIASAINEPSTGWKANNPVVATGDGEKVGIFLAVREIASAPPGAAFLQQALKNAGIGGQGIEDPRLPVGSSKIMILICRKN
ncbi:hypothetical protein SAMN05421771_1771 [Granulicella pectinivorans]|uniref:Uncharacterized protein n=1 Tax=Granulicella pectinivorans TaxID=474950 RepID=A0A1I6M3M0_9BACT|nr:hypothetical protein [Granulicella pectinivorans]SFS10286.1 hypothetical protein SAMN05421771_1771 [Granulicella pectinivorans]